MGLKKDLPQFACIFQIFKYVVLIVLTQRHSTSHVVTETHVLIIFLLLSNPKVCALVPLPMRPLSLSITSVVCKKGQLLINIHFQTVLIVTPTNSTARISTRLLTPVCLWSTPLKPWLSLTALASVVSAHQTQHLSRTQQQQVVGCTHTDTTAASGRLHTNTTSQPDTTEASGRLHTHVHVQLSYDTVCLSEHFGNLFCFMITLCNSCVLILVIFMLTCVLILFS